MLLLPGQEVPHGLVGNVAVLSKWMSGLLQGLAGR